MQGKQMKNYQHLVEINEKAEKVKEKAKETVEISKETQNEARKYANGVAFFVYGLMILGLVFVAMYVINFLH